MTVRGLAKALGLRIRTGEAGLDREITGGYVSDLLSDVLAHSREGNAWVTLQIHENVVAVAAMKDLAAIILINGREPEEGTLKRAESEGIPILVSDLAAFELVGRFYGMSLSGGT